MREVHQIVDHQHVICLDRIHRVLVGPAFAVVVVGKIDDAACVGARGIAYPDPDEAVFFHRRVAVHGGTRGNALLTRDAYARARPVEYQPVVAALQAALGHAAQLQRRASVRATVGQRANPARGIAEQHDRFAANSARQRLLSLNLVTPGGDVPFFANEQVLPPRALMGEFQSAPSLVEMSMRAGSELPTN